MTRLIIIMVLVLVGLGLTCNPSSKSYDHCQLVPIGVRLFVDGRPVTGKVKLAFFRLGRYQTGNWQFVTATGKADDMGYFTADIVIPDSSSMSPVARALNPPTP